MVPNAYKLFFSQGAMIYTQFATEGGRWFDSNGVHYVTDILGSVRALVPSSTDLPSNGPPSGRYNYDPYGNQLTSPHTGLSGLATYAGKSVPPP
jgi:hypothetical protein